MSYTPDNSNLQSRLLLVGEALKGNDVSLALRLLLDLRDTGFVNKELDHHIQTLHENVHTRASYPDIIPPASEWVYSTVELLRRTGAEDFEQIEQVDLDLFDFPAEDFVSFDIDSTASKLSPVNESSENPAFEIDFDFPFAPEISSPGSDELDFDFDLSFDKANQLPTPTDDAPSPLDWFDDFDNSADLSSPGLTSAAPFDTSSLTNQSIQRERQQTPTSLVAVPDNPFKNNANTPTKHHAINEELREPSNVLAEPAAPAPDPFDNLFEEEFYEQARSLHLEEPSELTASRPLYRGEPLRKTSPNQPSSPSISITNPSDFQVGHEPTNPFAHEAPTGVNQPSLQELSAVSESSKVDDNTILLQQVRKLYDSGKFQSALDIIENILSQKSTPEAEQLKQNIERELERQHHERIGSLSRTPALAVSLNELSSLQLDHRAGFIISQMDGMLTFEDIIDLSAMSRLETMSVLADLCDRGIITAR